MYRVRDWAEVHRLFEREGWSKTEIAGSLGMSRNTVDRLLSLSVPPRYERPSAGSKLDPFRASILMMLDTDAKAAATVIIDRLRVEGYSGGITILKDYLREVRPVFIRARSYQRPVICRVRSVRRIGGISRSRSRSVGACHGRRLVW